MNKNQSFLLGVVFTSDIFYIRLFSAHIDIEIDIDHRETFQLPDITTYLHIRSAALKLKKY